MSQRSPDESSGKEPEDRRPKLGYLCICGHQVELQPGTKACPECGTPVPPGLGEDPNLTVTLCTVLPTVTDALAKAPEEAVQAEDVTLGNVVKHPDAMDQTIAALSGDPDDPSQGSGSSVLSTGEAEARVSAGKAAKRAGRKLGHFVLKETLGAGGMGSVYRALDTSLERFVAVKVLRDTASSGSASSGTSQTERLRREAVAQARLNHPRVVTIYYVGREGEDPFLAMELLPGPTLQARLENGPLPYEELSRYALQVTEALAAADRSGLIHADIKPSNLLMDGNGNIKLSDFGLARRSGSSSPDGGVSGTPSYMAPELVDGHAPDRRSDMYALGITFFELAFGRRPYDLQGESLHERLLSHHVAPVEFPEKWPPEIPESFRHVLTRLLAKDPEDRYETYETLREDLQAVAPVGSTAAGRLARSIAWVVDLMCLGCIQIPLMIPSLVINALGDDISEAYSNWGGSVPFSLIEFAAGALGIFGLVSVPALSMWWDLKRWRTPGRYLMQLRVVDEHGLPPPRRVLMLRNLMRYMDLWVSALFCLPLVLHMPAATLFEETVGRLWMLIDAVFVFGPRRRALHDRICRTHVVLDETSGNRIRFERQTSAAGRHSSKLPNADEPTPSTLVKR